ncbi:NYN domain-containing protein [Candidatus Berkelbacteria bacterium]|nr:NYN domain-containing protein [Candidatus Berkelbacteria bacterium]
MTQQRTHLYLDGQNFLRRIAEVIRRRGVSDYDVTKVDFWGLLNHVFKDRQVDLASIYVARVRPYEDTKEKSEELMVREAALKELLERQGFRYVTGGTVRARARAGEVTFEEKGVDVTIAVEMTRDMLEGKVSTVILGSSDSDLQPVVKLAKEKGVKLIYLASRARYNRGLVATADETIFMEADDIARFYPDTKPTEPEQPARTSRRRRRRMNRG